MIISGLFSHAFFSLHSKASQPATVVEELGWSRCNPTRTAWQEQRGAREKCCACWDSSTALTAHPALLANSKTQG